MSWPLSQDYNEAIQSPASSFSDPELRAGQATTNALGIPQPRSGNFADVYEVDCPRTGNKWAVKCFTREVPGLHERYTEISRHLQAVNLPFAVDFQYLEQGIRIRGVWYPVLKMRWVEGLLLNEFVRANLDKPARLTALSQIWLRMAKRLREARLAHADLQHGNVILVPGSSANSLALKLIDYDGMFVPALAGKSSGQVGHPNFQHPQRLKEGTYGPEVDRFPFLVVATALRALAVGGQQLWERYDNGDNLLFKESDLRAPAESPLFKDLRQIGDPETRALLEQLTRAVGRPLEECPLLEEPAPAKPVAKAVPRSVSGKAPASSARSAETPNFAFEENESGRRARGEKTSLAPILAAAVGGVVLVLALGISLLVWALGSGKPQSTPAIAQVAVGDDTKTPKARPTQAPPKIEPVPPPVVEGPKKTPETSPKKEPGVDTSKVDVGEVQRFTSKQGEVRRVAWSHDGKRVLAACWNNSLYAFDMPGLTAPRELKGHTAGVNDIVFLPGEKAALSCSPDKTLRLWDLKEGRLRNSLDGEGPVHSVAVSADGRWAASCGNSSTVLVWDLERERVLRRLRGHRLGVESITFSPKGEILLSGDFNGTIRAWSTQNGKNERLFKGHTGTVTGLRVTPDGNYVVSGGQDKTVRLWSLHSGRELKRYEGHTEQVMGVAIAPDGRRILSCGADRTLRLWDIETGKEIHRFTGHTVHVWDVAFSPSGEYALSAGGDGTVRLWRLPPPDALARKPLDIPEPALAEKPPVPTGAALASAEADIREAFKAGYAKRLPAEKRALAAELLKRGLSPKEKPEVRYVLLREACVQAAKALDPDLALQAVDEIAQRFRVNAAEMQATALEQAGAGAGLGPTTVTVAETALVLVETALATDEYEVAERLLRVAQTASNAARNVELQNRAQAGKKRLEIVRKEWEAARAAEKALVGKEGNAVANLTVGKFHALTKGDWDRGLPYLAKGADSQLRDLATKDLRNRAKIS